MCRQQALLYLYVFQRVRMLCKTNVFIGKTLRIAPPFFRLITLTAASPVFPATTENTAPINASAVSVVSTKCCFVHPLCFVLSFFF